MRFDGVMMVQPTPRSQLDLLGRVRKAVRDLGLRMYPPFRDVDTKRRGVLTFSQAKTVLTVLKLDLNGQDFEELRRRFCTPDGMFRYPAFCAEVEPEPSMPPMADLVVTAIPAVGGTGVAAARALCAASGSSIATTALDSEIAEDSADAEEEDAALEAAEAAKAASREVDDLRAKISKRVRNEGLEMLHVFDGFSKTRWAKPGYVTVNQFARALDMLGFRFNDRQREALFKAYADKDGQQFNYLDFCAVVDPSRACKRPSTAKETAARTQTRAQQAVPSSYYDRSGRIRPLTSRPCSAPCTRRAGPQPHMRVLGMTG